MAMWNVVVALTKRKKTRRCLSQTPTKMPAASALAGSPNAEIDQTISRYISLCLGASHFLHCIIGVVDHVTTSPIWGQTFHGHEAREDILETSEQV